MLPAMFPLLNRIILSYLLYPLQAKTPGGFSAMHFSFTTSQTLSLHVFPAVSGEEQVNSVVLQVLLLHQVGADQLPDLRCSICRKEGKKERMLPHAALAEGVSICPGGHVSLGLPRAEGWSVQGWGSICPSRAGGGQSTQGRGSTRLSRVGRRSVCPRLGVNLSRAGGGQGPDVPPEPSDGAPAPPRGPHRPPRPGLAGLPRLPPVPSGRREAPYPESGGGRRGGRRPAAPPPAGSPACSSRRGPPLPARSAHRAGQP